MEQLISFKLGKEYIKAVCCHPVCLTYMQSTSYEMLSWMNRKRIKVAGRNINKLVYMDDTTVMVESQEELQSLLMRVKEESGNAGLKLHFQKNRIMASGPITSCK